MISLSAKLGIGTVQWGMNYGVSNNNGQTSQFEAVKILGAAHTAGVSLIDTASLYGDAESVLGNADLSNFLVVTKTPCFSSKRITHKDVNALKSAFASSLSKLNLSSIYGLLVHDASNIYAPGGELLVDALVSLKRESKVQKIGFSAYTHSQIHKACQCFKPDIVQVPVNVFDQRLVSDGTIKSLFQSGVEVHARSIFLQGLLLMATNSIPPYFSPWTNHIQAWHDVCESLNLLPQIVALQWACSIPYISYALVGIQNHLQLHELTSVPQISLPIDQLRDLSSDEEGLLNPILWRL
jgi:aryl-alcohol dehydrogenase-like predicted oxidoreductase